MTADVQVASLPSSFLQGRDCYVTELAAAHFAQPGWLGEKVAALRCRDAHEEQVRLVRAEIAELHTKEAAQPEGPTQRVLPGFESQQAKFVPQKSLFAGQVFKLDVACSLPSLVFVLRILHYGRFH